MKKPVSVIELENRLKELRDRAQALASGAEREKLLREARLIETQIHLGEWVSSKELQPPHE